MHAALNILGLVAVVGSWPGSPAPRLSEPLAARRRRDRHLLHPARPRDPADPGVVLIGLLPPLLYAAAIRTSLVDFQANRRAIMLLSVGLVVFTTVGVGLVAWWLLPASRWPPAFALGAVVAPPDAVAATAVARRVGMPRRIVAILEGESLVNDATALVALNTAIAAITGTRQRCGASAGTSCVAAGGGIAVGLVAAFVLAPVRRHITDPVLDTTLSFAAPFVAFLPAEELHSSGRARRGRHRAAPRAQGAGAADGRSRIAENINWRTVQFLLENTVFLLIGLQCAAIVDDVPARTWPGAHDRGGLRWPSWSPRSSPGWRGSSPRPALLRPAAASRRWDVALGGHRVVGRHARRGDAGGGVPAAGGARPQRDLLPLAAFTVVAGTLLVQGLTLPWLVRRLGLPGPGRRPRTRCRPPGWSPRPARAGLAALERARDARRPRTR